MGPDGPYLTWIDVLCVFVLGGFWAKGIGILSARQIRHCNLGKGPGFLEAKNACDVGEVGHGVAWQGVCLSRFEDVTSVPYRMNCCKQFAGSKIDELHAALQSRS